MPEESVLLRTSEPGASHTLEGVLALPHGRGKHPGVVVCHPHPLYGGSMSNNVVLALCRALEVVGVASLRFNFRGVGRSEGHYGGGSEECFDAEAALNFLEAHPRIKRGHIGLAGYSFGSRVSVTVADQDPRVQAVVAVSLLTHGLLTEGTLHRCERPKLFLVGDQDSLVALEEVSHFVAALPEPKELHVITGADHFWGGYEGALGAAVSRFFATHLAAPSVSEHV